MRIKIIILYLFFNISFSNLYANGLSAKLNIQNDEHNDISVIQGGSDPPCVFIENVNDSGCNDGQICFSVSGDTSVFTVNLQNQIGEIISSLEVANGGQDCFSSLSPGKYNIVTIGGVNDNCLDLEQIVGSTPTGMAISIDNLQNASCFGGTNGSVLLIPSNGMIPYTYNWNDNTYDGMQSSDNLVPGSYVVTVTDENGCAVITDFVITSPTQIQANIQVSPVGCISFSDGSAEIQNVMGGNGGPHNYMWDNGDTAPLADSLTVGTHCVTITEENAPNCSEVQCFDIPGPTPIVVDEDIVHVLCFGENNGEILISANGGAGGFSYLWSNNSISQQILDLSPGDYTYTVTDANDCSFSNTINVEEPDSLIALAMVISDVSCDGDSDGSATVQPTGGVGNYSYVWSDGILSFHTQTIENVGAGTYNTIVTDANGCTADDSVEIKKEEKPDITNYDDYDNYNDGELTDLYFEANLDEVTFLWDIIEHSNIDTSASDYHDFGETDAVIEERFHLITNRSPGWVLINVYPQLGDCIGDTVQSTVSIYSGEKGCPFIPELFTPNNDGTNDYWEVVFPNPDGGSEYSVKVFNRSGGVVFESSSFTEQWTANGCPDGVYFYIITHQVEQTQCKGAVTILRK